MKNTTRSSASVLMALAGMAFPGVLGGCSSEPPSKREALMGVSKAESTAERAPVQPKAGAQSKGAPAAASGRTPVVIENTAIPAEDLQARLGEAAGSVVLEEVVLDRGLTKLVAQRKIEITREMIDAERAQLISTFEQEAKLTHEQAEAALENVRRGRGLGPVRFEALLTRNAQLRALARQNVELTNEEVDRALAIEFGPRYKARVIVLDDARKLAEFRGQMDKVLRPPVDIRMTEQERLDEAKKPLSQDRVDLALALFAQWAVKESQHPSAPQGGQIAEMSPADVSYPAAVREALPTLDPGKLSPVFATDQGAWMVMIEKKIEGGASPTEQDRMRVQARLLARKERMEMDHIAREVLATARITVFDPGLRWSWEGRPRE